MKRHLALAIAAAWWTAGAGFAQFEALVAQGHDRRIDITWTGPDAQAADGLRFIVYRSATRDGEFEPLSDASQDYTVYSDYVGENGRRFFYRVAAFDSAEDVRATSRVVFATTRRMDDDELLTSVQQATFRYFWDFAHPVSGMAREGLQHPRDTCTTGGTGFGILTIMVGAQRGFVSREAAAGRVLKIARFLAERATRYHGAWSHWIHGATGETIPFAGEDDDGGDIVETAFLMQGLLAARQYFDGDGDVERELRALIDRLWREVEWDWYLGEPPGKQLIWHWSPRFGFKRGHRIGGHFNECMIAYILAIASPTHPIPPEYYYDGWVRDAKTYANGRTFYGRRLAVGFDYGGPLFFTHYSYLGLAPHAVTDRFCNYFDNNRTISLINHAYCADNPNRFAGYGELVWGLTASFSVDGYRAHEPRVDNGTITPTAAISAMPYVPKKSIATLKHFYRELGGRIWGPFGFRDAFNLQRHWVSDTYLAIDQGTIVPMIENHRTQLCWRMFMRNADVVEGLKRAGVFDERRAAAFTTAAPASQP